MWSSPLLTLNGWIAFDLPRTVTALGAALLCGIVAVHGYVVASYPALPTYFLAYVAVLAVGCLVATVGITWGAYKSAAQRAWDFGSLCCLAFLGIYLATRVAALPGLVSLTGRWDVAPGTLSAALAAAFIGIHATVLSGVNVAYPHRQRWQD